MYVYKADGKGKTSFKLASDTFDNIKIVNCTKLPCLCKVFGFLFKDNYFDINYCILLFFTFLKTNSKYISSSKDTGFITWGFKKNISKNKDSLQFQIITILKYNKTTATRSSVS